jgi:hypothetical protein
MQKKPNSLPTLTELFLEVGLPPLNPERSARLVEGAVPILNSVNHCISDSLFHESLHDYGKALEANADPVDAAPCGMPRE